MNHPRPGKEERRLENRISHWEAQIEQRRRSVHATYDHRVEAAKEGPQREHWEAKRDAALAAIDVMEQERLEPMRAAYRAILGLD